MSSQSVPKKIDNGEAGIQLELSGHRNQGGGRPVGDEKWFTAVVSFDQLALVLIQRRQLV